VGQLRVSKLVKVKCGYDYLR